MDQRIAPRHVRARQPISLGAIARVVVAVVLGLALGFFGLPRLKMPTSSAPPVTVTPDIPPCCAGQPTAIPAPSGLNLGSFDAPLAGWVNDPNAMTWFGADLSYDRLPSVGGVGVFAGGDLNKVALDWLCSDNIE